MMDFIYIIISFISGFLVGVIFHYIIRKKNPIKSIIESIATIRIRAGDWRRANTIGSNFDVNNLTFILTDIEVQGGNNNE